MTRVVITGSVTCCNAVLMLWILACVKNTHLIKCAGISSVPCTVHKRCFICLLHCISSTDVCNTITYEQTENIPVSYCVKVTDCAQTVIKELSFFIL